MTATYGLIRQATQLRKSDTYTDNLAAGATLESGSTSIESDLNALRSQVNYVLDATGTTGKWYDAVATVNAKKRSIKQLNTDLNTLELAAASLATLDQLKERIALIEFSFAGATPPTVGANTNKLGFVHTTGGAFTAGQVVLDTGTALTVISFDVVRHLTTTAVVTGTINLNANGLYAYENGVWVSKGGGLSVGLLDLFTIGSTPTSQTPGTGVVTATNLNTLTAGSSSNADALHTHVIPAGVSAGDGLLDTATVLSVRLSGTNPALSLIGTSPTKTLEVATVPNATGAGGIEKAATGLQIDLDGTTLQLGTNGVSVKGVPSSFEINGVATHVGTPATGVVTAANLDTLTAGSASNADSLHTHTMPAVKSAGDGLTESVNVISIALSGTNPSLTLAGTSPAKTLEVAVVAPGAGTGGIEKTATGLQIDLDGTTLQLAAGGISVKGVPAQFEISGSAVSANVTHTNLNALTAGSGTTLHTHADLPLAGGSLTGQVANTPPATMVPNGTTQTVNWNLGNLQVIDLGSATGTVVVTMQNPVEGAVYELQMIQDVSTPQDVSITGLVWDDGYLPVVAVGSLYVTSYIISYRGGVYRARWGGCWAS